jgi:hypothetical protein
MCPAIGNPTSCEICAENMRTVEIHSELCVVYSQNVMHEGTVTQWYRMFKDGRTNVHDEKQSGWLSVVSSKC